MGPFSTNSYLVKTIAFGRSRPTTSTNIRIPFNLLCQGIQAMRQAGITVTAVTNIYNNNTIVLSDNQKTQSPKASQSKKSEKETELKSASRKERRAPNRRTKKKS